MTNNPPMTFPEKLRQLMRERAFSARDLADALATVGVEVGKSTVNAWSKDGGNPRLSEAVGLARVFGVGIKYLAYDELEAPSASKAYPPDFPPDGPAARVLTDKRPIKKAAPARRKRGKGAA